MVDETTYAQALRSAPPAWRGALPLWPLAGGLLVLVVLWVGPLPEMSRRAFSIHMVLHLGVAVVAAPLVAIGAARASLGRVDPRHAAIVALAASAFELLVVWGWHVPVLHEAAARDDGMFAAQQASFLAAGIAVWLAAFSGGTRAASGIGALAMLATFMHMAMLGVLLALAPRLLYAPDICQGAFGLDGLQDQRLGGALMAVAGGAPYLIGGLVLTARVLAERPVPAGR